MPKRYIAPPARKPLRHALRPSAQWLSPGMIVVLVVLLQAALLGAYFYLAGHDRLAIEADELTLLLAYSLIAVALAVVVGWQRHRWLAQENTVRQRLLDVIDAIPDPSAVRDTQGRYVMWNKAAEQYHGIKAEHVVGKTPFDLFPKEVARSILQLDADCMREKHAVVQRVQLPPLYGKGQRVALIRVASVSSASDDSLRGVVTILHDVTESERASTDLAKATTQLRLALHTSGFGSWVWTLDTNEVSFTQQYAHLLRYKGSNFQRDFNIKSRIHPDDLAHVKAAMDASFKEGKPFDEVYRLRCFDGEFRPFHASGEVHTDAQGQRHFSGLLCPLSRED